jgi:hypothetical protein
MEFVPPPWGFARSLFVTQGGVRPSLCPGLACLRAVGPPNVSQTLSLSNVPNAMNQMDRALRRAKPTPPPKPHLTSGPKGHNKPAQGNALGDRPPRGVSPERASQPDRRSLPAQSPQTLSLSNVSNARTSCFCRTSLPHCIGSSIDTDSSTIERHCSSVAQSRDSLPSRS